MAERATKKVEATWNAGRDFRLLDAARVARHSAYGSAFLWRQALLVSVPDEQLCRVDGHRAVEEHRHVGDAFGALEHMQMIEQVLRAPHSEGYDKRAAASCRPADYAICSAASSLPCRQSP